MKYWTVSDGLGWVHGHAVHGRSEVEREHPPALDLADGGEAGVEGARNQSFLYRVTSWSGMQQAEMCTTVGLRPVSGDIPVHWLLAVDPCRFLDAMYAFSSLHLHSSPVSTRKTVVA